MRSWVLVAALTVVGAVVLDPGVASAAISTPSVSAVPSKNLFDGQPILVVDTGFAPGDSLSVTECAQINGAVLCDLADNRMVTADRSGRAYTALTVRRQYAAYTDSGVPAGTVNCTTAPNGCAVATKNVDFSRSAFTPISFRAR